MSQSVASTNVLKSEAKEYNAPHSIYHADGSYNPFHSEANKRKLLKAMENIRLGRNLIPKTMEELEAMEND